MTTPSHRFERLFNLSVIKAPKGFCAISTDPVCLEIGAGKGRHALLFAQSHPSQTLIAIERTAHKFTAFAKATQSASLPNLTAIHADAVFWSVHALYPQQVETCFILYPNPEPHNKNQRFVNMPFFEFLLSRMAKGGQIIIASNITDYIDEAKVALDEIWRLPYECVVVDKSSQRTHFEMKYLARGELCQELIITKPCEYCTRFDDVLPRLGVDL